MLKKQHSGKLEISMTDENRRPGRPEGSKKLLEPQTKKLIALTDEEWAFLERLGKGQITRGAREAIKIAKSIDCN